MPDQPWRIICADWREAMASLPDASIDLIITDPPYESLNKWREIGTTARLGGHRDPDKRDESMWFPTISNDDIPDLVQECYRVLKPNTHCYIMCDYDTLPILHYAAVVEPVFQHIAPLIWDKQVAGMGYHYRRSFEFVMMLDKGKNRRLNDLSVRDVLSFPPPRGKRQWVPTQKPVELFEALVQQSSQPGEVVLDPFLGSGAALVAAIRNGRVAIGSDISPEYCRLAEARLQTEADGWRDWIPSLPDQPTLAEGV